MAFDKDKNKFATAGPIPDLPTDGSSTTADIEAAVNAVLAALRAAGVVQPTPA